MKTLNYLGFSNSPSSCLYGVGQITGQYAIVFYQDALKGTSITNMIETLTMHVLASDLPGINPRDVRVFEHYNPALNPLIEWQEVTFQDIGVIQPNINIAQRLINLVLQSDIPKTWYVDNPQWRSVKASEIAILSKI